MIREGTPVMDSPPGNILIKSEEPTNPEYGQPPEQRPLSEYINRGIACVDKPEGPTSHQVSTWVRDMLGVKKAGHSGTLDPKVTGLLPIALGDATRILDGLLLSGKTYVGVMKLHNDVPRKRVLEVFEEFMGEIYQKPPLKSAVKRQLRTRHIHELTAIEFEGRCVLFEVSCEAGTYIRKLAHDIGLVLGSGAHMQQLRRTRVGPFTEEDMVRLHDLKDAWESYRETGEEAGLRELIQPQEKAVAHLPKLWIKDGAVDALCHGAFLYAPGVAKLAGDAKEGGVVAVLTLKDELVGFMTSLHDSQAIIEKNKGEVAKPRRVVMEPGVYPRQWTKHI